MTVTGRENTLSEPVSIKLPKSVDTYIGRKFTDVEEEFRAYGFTNIALLPKKDLIKGWMTKDGAVEEISIAGKTNFKKGQRYLSDHRIVITYHTFRHTPPPTPPAHEPPFVRENPESKTESNPEATGGVSDFSEKQTEESSKKTRELKCKGCNGVMEVDFDNGVAICPYCGSTETISESDSVKIERMRRKSEAERRKHELEAAERQERKEAIGDFKAGELSKVLIGGAVLALLLASANFNYRPFASALMLVSGAVLAFSWIVGAGHAKKVRQQSYIFFAIAGLVLLIVAFSLG